MRYNIVREEGKPTSATVFHRGRIYVAAKDHPNFDAIIDALEQKRPAREVVDLFDTASAVARGFKIARKLLTETAKAFADGFSEERELRSIAKDIEVKGKKLYFRGEEVHGALASAIVRYQSEGNKDYRPLVKFFAKVLENPNPHSREHLYAWMQHKSFLIHEDGDIIAYKGMNRAMDSAGRKVGYRATTNGPGFINGKAKNLGNDRQRIGDVVSMPREQVTFDPRQGCSSGLHVGAWGFASSYGSAMVEVKIHPKNVVSVPTDSHEQKMRVCEYELHREVTEADRKIYRSGGTAVARV